MVPRLAAPGNLSAAVAGGSGPSEPDRHDRSDDEHHGADGSYVLRLHQIRVPLVEPMRSASGELHERTSIIVEAEGADGVRGWGECVVLDGLDYPVASLEVAWAWLCAGPDTWAIGRDEAGASIPRTAPRSAAGALRDALWDLGLRRDGISLASWLGGSSPRERVSSARVLGIAGDIDALVAAAQEASLAGHRHLVCKIRPGWDVEPLCAVRDALPSVGLAADANGSYAPDDGALDAIDELALAWLEQPVAPGDLAGSARVAARLATPVVLDESVVSVHDLERAMRAGALDGLNVKPGRNGGAIEAQWLAAIAAEAGLDVLVGGLLETGIGRAAAVALAAAPVITLPTDLGPSDRYLASDLTEPFVLGADGTLRVPTGPGIGVTPRLDRLAALTVRRAEVRVER